MMYSKAGTRLRSTFSAQNAWARRCRSCLNTAFMRGGVEIAVEPHYEAALPIEIYCVTLADQPKAIFSRSVFACRLWIEGNRRRTSHHPWRCARAEE